MYAAAILREFLHRNAYKNTRAALFAFGPSVYVPTVFLGKHCFPRKTNTSDFQVSISHDFGMNPKMLDLGPGLQCAFFQWPGVTGAYYLGSIRIPVSTTSAPLFLLLRPFFAIDVTLEQDHGRRTAAFTTRSWCGRRPHAADEEENQEGRLTGRARCGSSCPCT